VCQDRLALEAQRMLIYSSAPVSLIAYELCFSDPAYFFSRFFKRRIGTTPSVLSYCQIWYTASGRVPV
jgi:AraC family transcriptional activator of pobA